ncbi:MAG: radical SAM protein [Candidatus Gygaella obscura]|nr:radical SAM protein [Candidatus Gygaella obscura]
MKIVLVNPIWSFENILSVNLTELAAYIREKGFSDISIIDFNFELRPFIGREDMLDRAVEILSCYKPDVIGITCNAIHVPFSVELSIRIKKLHPKIKIVLGGLHPTSMPKRMLYLSKADFIVRGEGEITFFELLNKLNGSKVPLKKIEGLSFRSGKRIVHNQDRGLITDISTLPFPAFDLLSGYVDNFNKTGLLSGEGFRIDLNASRGCPYRCIFCSSNRVWKYQRRKTVERVIEEIKFIKERFKCGLINFADDCITLNRAWFLYLLSELKKLDLKWSCLSRIDFIDESLLIKMKDSGCINIYHGIETGSNRVRKILNKNFKPGFNNLKMTRLVDKEVALGIKSVCQFMLGVPGEKEKDIYKSIRLAEFLKNKGADIQIGVMTPLPDTTAAQVYKKDIIKVDRWKNLRQGDINTTDQMLILGDLHNKYKRDNYDFYMFRPIFKLDRFFLLYRLFLEKIGIDDNSKNRLFNYIKTTKHRKYMVCKDRQLEMIHFSVAKKERYIYLPLNNSHFNNYKKIVNRLVILLPKLCFIVFDMDKESLFKQKNHITDFIKLLQVHKIKFKFLKPLPVEFKDLVNLNEKILPRNCEDCNFLFSFDKKGKIKLCNAGVHYNKSFFCSRVELYLHFLRLGCYGVDYDHRFSCYNFPTQQNFLSIRKNYNHKVWFLDEAKRNFLYGDFDSGAKMLKEYLKYEHSDLEARIKLVQYYEKKDDFKKCLQQLRIARKISPNNLWLMTYLIKIMKKKGLNNKLDLELRRLNRLMKTVTNKDNGF